METTLVGIISGGITFFKTIVSDTEDGAKKEARSFMRNNTKPGTSSKAALWKTGGIIAHIHTKSEKISRKVLAKRRILY